MMSSVKVSFVRQTNISDTEGIKKRSKSSRCASSSGSSHAPQAAHVDRVFSAVARRAALAHWSVASFGRVFRHRQVKAEAEKAKKRLEEVSKSVDVMNQCDKVILMSIACDVCLEQIGVEEDDDEEMQAEASGHHCSLVFARNVLQHIVTSSFHLDSADQFKIGRIDAMLCPFGLLFVPSGPLRAHKPREPNPNGMDTPGAFCTSVCKVWG